MEDLAECFTRSFFKFEIRVERDDISRFPFISNSFFKSYKE